MKRTKLSTRMSIASAFLAAAFAPVALAQVAPAPAAEAPASAEAKEDEAILLSPFEVSASSQQGYMATSSLAGSRLNTQLKDIPAPISVVTEQFLKDTGSTNLESLLVYTNNTEVGGLQGNYGGDATLVRQAPQKATRIRGLNGADITRDFFATDIPFDSYNTMQVDINRGANSILYGLGSPAGIINYMLKTPMMRDKYGVEFKVNQYGSLRSSVDLDTVVMPKVLGVRVNALNSEQQYQQKHKFEHNKRLDAVIRFTPRIADSIYTQIQGRVETGRTIANRPETTPPSDYISNWFTRLNKFSNANTWPGYTFATIPDKEPYLAAYQAGPGGNWWDELGVIYSDPTRNVTGGKGIPDAFRQRGGTGVNAGSWISPANPTSNTNKALHYLNQKAAYANNPIALSIINDYEKATGKVFAGGWGWSDVQITDTSVFDYYNDSLAGPNNHQWNQFHDENLSLVQTFFDNRLGYELSFDRQSFKDGERRLIDDASRLAIDINQTLRDNVTPNPNYGRAVLVSGNNSTANLKERETVRATAFYKLKFADFIKKDWVAKTLGEHTFTGLASTQTFNQLSYSHAMYKWGEGYTKRFENKPGLVGVHYLNSDVNLVTASSLAGAHIRGLDVQHTPGAAPSAMVVDNVGINGMKLPDWTTQSVDVWSHLDEAGLARLYGNQPTSFKDRDTAKAFIWQSWFLDNTVVGLFAVRNDNYKKWTKGNPVINPAYDAVAEPNSPSWTWTGKGSSLLAANKTKRSYGLMLHTPKFIKRHLPYGTELSLGYNESSNFQPGQLGRDPYGNQYSAPSGTTKDYTVLINTLDDKVSLRATWFKSVQGNSEIGGLSDWSVKSRLARAMNGLMAEAWGATGSGWSGRNQTTPEPIVNKWFFGSSYDATVANTPLPSGWTVASHPELLSQPLRVRAAALTVKEGDTFVNDQGQTVAYTEPPITAEEAEYRRAWFRARTDEEWARPFGMTLFKSLNLNRDYGYWGGIWPEGGVPNLKGIGDNIAKGAEFELTVNPTRNWRIMANVSKVSATTANVWSAIGDYVADFGKTAKDGWDPTVLQGTSINYWKRDGFADIDAWGNNGGQMLGWDWFSDVEKAYLTKKAAEGKSVGELRTWHANIVSGYDFTHGALKGLGVGATMRWQSASTLGYYPKYLKDIKVWVDDLDRPIKGPSEVNYDMWVSYKYKLSEKIDMRLQLNVRDVLNNKSLIPTRTNPDGTFAQYRIPGGRTWELTTAFEF